MRDLDLGQFYAYLGRAMYRFLTKVVRRVRRKRWAGWPSPIVLAGC